MIGPAARWVADHARPIVVIYWLALVTATHWPNLAIDQPQIQALHPDKLIHVALYATLVVLLTLARPIGRSWDCGFQIALCAVVAAAYSIIDEVTQPMFGRTYSTIDVAANLVGVVVGLALLPVVWRWARGPEEVADE